MTLTAEDPSDLGFMDLALALAREAADAGEVPIGCVVVRDGHVLSMAANAMERLQDATSHAEVRAIAEASRTSGSWRLDGCTLYVTLEPCPMCAGAILNSRIARVVYGARDRRLGACDTHFRILADNPIHREVEVVGGVRESESAALLKAFFRDLREGLRERSRQRRMGAAPFDS